MYHVGCEARRIRFMDKVWYVEIGEVEDVLLLAQKEKGREYLHSKRYICLYSNPQ